MLKRLWLRILLALTIWIALLLAGRLFGWL